MRILFFSGLLFASMALTSCGEENENTSGLSVQVSGSGTVIPFDLNSNCVGDSVTGSRFSINTMNIEWTKFDQDLVINLIRIEFASGNVTGGVSTHYISDEDIDDFFAFEADDATTTNINLGRIEAPQEGEVRKIFNKTNCRLHIGGISMVDDQVNFSARATITVFGTAIGNDAGVSAGSVVLDDEEPVRASTTMRIEYDFN